MCAHRRLLAAAVPTFAPVLLSCTQVSSGNTDASSVTFPVRPSRSPSSFASSRRQSNPLERLRVPGLNLDSLQVQRLMATWLPQQILMATWL